jgi:5-methylcytosine-specific restriction endonuclease McrA
MAKAKKVKLFFPKLFTEHSEVVFDQSELKAMTKITCKPCWELKYCPYGPLVEGFPLPSIPRHRAVEHNEYLKKCLKERKFGDGKPLDKMRKKYFSEEVKNFKKDDYPEKVDKELIYMSCSYFGHLCPVFFSAEPFTETEEFRSQSRTIPRPVLIRVVRRDDSMCQECGNKLLDKDIEIDHIIPWSKGGTTTENNLRVICSDCNKKKSDNSDAFLNERSKFKSRKKYYDKEN